MPKIDQDDSTVVEPVDDGGAADVDRGRGIRLAVNLFDLDRVDPTVREMLLTGKLDLKAGAIRVDPSRPDEGAVAFACDPLTAACIIDTLRSHDRRAGDCPTRAYVKRRAWSKLPGNVMLTVISGGKPALNPAVFGDAAVEEESLAPPALRKVW